jgi:ferritin
MSETIQKAINDQIHAELTASYSYLAMSAHCDRNNFSGAAKWLRLQSQEEYAHAMKLLDFMLARHAKVVLADIVRPKTDYASLLDVFETSFAQEQSVSAQISGLYELAFSQIRIAEANKDSFEIPDMIFEVKYVKAEILKMQNKNAETVYREIVEGDENWKLLVNEPYQNTILGRSIGGEEDRAKYGKAHFELGRMKYENGNFENALRFLEMAVLYKYKSDTAMRYLIDSYKRLGNTAGMDRAMSAYRRMK